jgi:hypothetical protein
MSTNVYTNQQKSKPAAVSLPKPCKPLSAAISPCEFEKSEEGIRNLEASEPLTVLEILRKKEIAPRLYSG